MTDHTQVGMPTFKEMATLLRIKRDEAAALTKAYEAAKKEIDDIIEGVEDLIKDSFPEGVDTQSVTFDDGAKGSVTKKLATQFRINEGQSTDFYDWAKANGRTDLLQKRILQTAMEAEVKANGLPPGAFVHTETKITMTVKRPAPAV